MKEQICIRYPAELANPLGVSQTTLVIDVPDNYSGITLAQEGIYLNANYEIGDVAANTLWFIPPSQILWVKRL